MSDQILKQLLLSAEEAPPATVWDRIDIQLTQVNEDLLFRSKIDLSEEEVPAQVWENIEAELRITEADKSLRSKIESIEEQAPLSSWNAIEQKLNDNELSDKIISTSERIPETAWPHIENELSFIEADRSLAEKLQFAEEEVPELIWSNIESALDEKPAQPVISIQRKYAAFYKLAAAIIAGILFWGGYNLFFNTTTHSTVAINQDSPIKETNPSPATPASEPEKTTAKNSSLPQKTEYKKNRTQPLASLVADVQMHTQANAIVANELRHNKTKQTTNVNSFDEDNYLIVINDDGDLIRVSKKLTQMKCAQNNSELPVDAVTALESKNCDNQIKNWQHKIATSQISGILDAREIINITEK